MNKTVEVLPDQAALIQRSLELILTKMRAAIQERGLWCDSLIAKSR